MICVNKEPHPCSLERTIPQNIHKKVYFATDVRASEKKDGS
nr:MAG TPA: hypothetical protein [Caudoviricetes sp.]